jgi:hypothetical protein
MPVTLRNQHGVGCRQSAPDASSSSDCVLAWLLAVSGIVLSREISPDASRSRRLRDAPISCRRKAPTAMRNAAHTRSGGVSTARSLSTGLTPFSPRSSPYRGGRSGPPACGHARARDRALWLAEPHDPGCREPRGTRRHSGPLPSRPCCGRPTGADHRRLGAQSPYKHSGRPLRARGRRPGTGWQMIASGSCALAATAPRCRTRVAGSDAPGRPALRKN